MKLKGEIFKVWGKGFLILLACFSLSGCFTKTVYVPDQTPIRLRQDLKDVKVWVMDDQGQIVAGQLDLKEGWFVLSLPNTPPVAEKSNGKLVTRKLR